MLRAMDELLTDFLAETAENLAALDDALLILERVPGDPATVALVFRLVHTLKGTCGFLSLPRLERVAHAAEDVLAAIRAGEQPATAALITVVLTALDRIRLIVDGLVATGTEPDGDDTALLAALHAGAPAAATAPAAEPDTAALPLAAADPAVQTIRLGVDVLENLMTLVSELVLTRNQLVQLARSQGDSRFTAPLQRLSHLTSDLQEGVVKTRMQPIMHAWRKLPRLVRDLGAELGKQVELSMMGGETELDRQVLELIQDPLVHMVRNSVDHGLEPPGRPPGRRQARRRPHHPGQLSTRAGTSWWRWGMTARGCAPRRSAPAPCPAAWRARRSWRPCRPTSCTASSSGRASPPPPPSPPCRAVVSAWTWCAPTSSGWAARWTCAA